MVGGAPMPWFTYEGPVFTCHPSIIIMMPWFTLQCPGLVAYYTVSLVVGRKGWGSTGQLLLFPSPMLVSHTSPLSPKLFLLAPEMLLLCFF